MEGSDDDIDLVPLTGGQEEQFTRIEQLWPEFGNSLQVLAASDGGGMGWRTVDGVEYLTRYTQENGKKKGRSLGRRSPETEAIMEQFDSTVLKARRIRREYREDVLLSCKLAKAYGIARLHGRFAETLDWLWYTDANKRVALFGGNALLAYESGSKTLTPVDLIKEPHLQFISHSEDPAEMGLVEIAEACGADPTGGQISMKGGRIVIRSDGELIAEIFRPSYFLERLERRQAKTLREGFEMPWLRALTFSRDTRPIELCTLDPRVADLAKAQQAIVDLREIAIWKFQEMCVDNEASRYEASAQTAIETIQTHVDTEARKHGYVSISLPKAHEFLKWVRHYEKLGKLGIVPRIHKRGNRKDRYGREVLLLVRKHAQIFLRGERPTKELAHGDLKVEIKQINDVRRQAGQKDLPTPDYDFMCKAISRLAPFDVVAGRHLDEAAKRKFHPSRGGMPNIFRAMQRIEIDDWECHLYNLAIEAGLWEYLSPEVQEAADKTRCNLSVAIDCHTRVLPAVVLSLGPHSVNTKTMLRMCIADKTPIAQAVGCETPWEYRGNPWMVAGDEGSAILNAITHGICESAGIEYICPQIETPQQRAKVERFFQTLEICSLLRFSGRAFNNPQVRGKYEAEARAVTTVEELAHLIVRFIVDVYHNTPHDGLDGDTPRNFWLHETKTAAPRAAGKPLLRRVFGHKYKVVLHPNGIEIFGNWYSHPQLEKRARDLPVREYVVIVDEEDLGGISVEIESGCPKCMAEDIAAAPRSRPQIVTYQRARWPIAALKTCAIHLTPLVVVDKDMAPSTLHDWAHHLGKVLPVLPRLVAEADTRPLTAFEAYVLDRTHGGPAGTGLIDTLPLHVAIAACELFGAVASFGRMPNLKTLTDEEWRQAGAAGFNVIGAGLPGIEAFLEDLQASYPYTRAGTEGPQAIFGRIYQVLEFGREDKAYDPLRAVVGDLILKNFPVGPGDVVFGKPVETRRLHSIRSLSIETGLHPKRLRKLLSSAEMLPPNADQLADGNCLFDAEKAVSLAQSAAAATLSVRDAGTYLNAPRVQRDMLYRSGIIVPRITATYHGAADQFAPADLDAFLARLLDGAVQVVAAGAVEVDIPTAAKAACCGSVEIVQAILDGRLTRKAQLASERGYMALLVDVEEVRALVRGADLGGLASQALADRLRVADKVTRKLIAGSHLRTVIAINPVNRCPVTIVPTEDIERFEAEFVSLFAIARQQGRHHMAVKKELAAAGVKPALDPEKVGATFYRRRDLGVAFLQAATKGES